jgi:hypothetical protein
MSEPVCRWCHKTEAEHLPPTQANRPRARMPCLGWQEHFSPVGQVAFSPSAPAPSDATSAPSMGDTSSGSSSDAHVCSFCSKTQKEVKMMIAAGAAASICDECIGLSVDLIEKAGTVKTTDAQRLQVLHEIYAEMRGAGGSTVIALQKYEDKVRARL